MRTYSQVASHFIDPDKLSWDNFKERYDDTTNAGAHTYSNIAITIVRYDFFGLTVPLVWAEFNDSSWYRKDSIFKLGNPFIEYALNHERGHYLITILFAKKFKGAITNKIYNSQQEIQNIYDSFYFQERKMQYEYDSATKHCQDFKKQAEWNIKIRSELVLFDDVILQERK